MNHAQTSEPGDLTGCVSAVGCGSRSPHSRSSGREPTVCSQLQSICTRRVAVTQARLTRAVAHVRGACSRTARAPGDGLFF